jgi:NADH-quinone oxidoreductase subunit M
MVVFPVLSSLILLPLLAACICLVLPARAVRVWALAASTLTFALSLRLYTGFDMVASGFQFVEKLPWISQFDLFWHLGIDGISLLLLLLSTFLVPICLAASWKSITERVPLFCASFLLLQALLVGVFASLDIFLFYIFFEAVLIPMYLLIGIWGGKRRLYAATKFFLYTLAGSLLLLAALIMLRLQTGSSDLAYLMNNAAIPAAWQGWLWWAMFIAFAIKVPMLPVHTWLPDAHVEAPTAGSVILAGVLLKMGGYGFLRLSLPLLPDASTHFAPVVLGLSAAAVIYASLVALAQSDMKKLIAYSSIAHMGFVTAGLFVGNEQAMTGAIVQMLSHGLVSGALFLCVGVLYDRLHTREISAYGGAVTPMPRFALVFMLFTLASVGLPGTSGFVGEFLVLLGVFKDHSTYALLLGSGLILGAAYALWLYRKVMFGAEPSPAVAALADISLREKLLFLPLIALVLLMGIYPKPFTDPLKPAVAHLLERLQPVPPATLPFTPTLAAAP